MAEERKNSWLVRFFWPLAIVVVAVVVAGFVVFFKFANGERDSVVDQLNQRYVQRIEIRSESTSNSVTRSVIYIDGERRDDCSEDNGKLTCSEDPQPTLERSQN